MRTQDLSIEDLVVRGQGGDRAALRLLYDRHVDAVYGYCLRFCRGDTHTARDLVQDTFATAFTRLGDLRDARRFSGWLKVITRRACLRWIEHKQVETRALERLATEPMPSPSRLDHTSSVVAEVIESCPDPGLAAVARLFYTDPPHSTNAIAAQLGISRTAVTSRLHRFRNWARKAMLGRLAEALEEAP